VPWWSIWTRSLSEIGGSRWSRVDIVSSPPPSFLRRHKASAKNVSPLLPPLSATIHEMGPAFFFAAREKAYALFPPPFFPEDLCPVGNHLFFCLYKDSFPFAPQPFPPLSFGGLESEVPRDSCPSVFPLFLFSVQAQGPIEGTSLV